MNKEKNENNFEEGPYTLYCTCSDCGRHLKVEYYNDNAFETYEKTFLGRLGTETVHHCPYCGKRSGGFSPYDPDEPMRFDELDAPISRAIDDDDRDGDTFEAEERGLDDGDSWWPDSEGVELEDEYDEDTDDPDDNPWEMDPADITKICTCKNCKESFRLNPKGCEKLYCLYCGKEI